MIGDVIKCKTEQGAYWGSFFTVGKNYTIAEIRFIKTEIITDFEK